MTEQPTTEHLIEQLACSAGGETGVNLSTLTEREAAKRLQEQAAEIAALREDNLELNAMREAFEEAGLQDIHSCGPHCRLPSCVLRREAGELRRLLERVVYEVARPITPELRADIDAALAKQPSLPLA